MKILFVCHEVLPSDSTSTEQVIRASSALASLGVDVLVSTPTEGSPDLPRLRADVADFYGIDSTAFEVGFDLAPLRLPAGFRGSLVRPVHDLQAARRAREGDIDLIYVRDPIPLLLALRTGKPVVFETYRYDLNERNAYALWRAACYGRQNLVGVVTHSEMAKRSFLHVGFTPGSVLVAHNGYDPPAEADLGRDQARQDLGLPLDRPLVVYAGGVSPRKGVDSILPVAGALPETDFLIVGHVPGSSGETWIQESISASGVSNVRLAPRVPPAEVARYLAAGDCLLIPTVSAPLYESRRTVLPMKTFPYLGAGRPIVAPDLEDVREVLEDGVNARLVPPDEPEHTIRALREILKDQALAARLSTGAQATVDRLGWRARARRILDFLERRNSCVSGGV